MYTHQDNKVTGLTVAYIGGGSRGWAWGFMRDIISDGQISGTVRLYDIDREAAERNQKIGMMLAARHPDAVGKLMVVDMVPFMGAMFGPPGTTAESVAPIAEQIYQGMANSPPEAYNAQAEASVTGMINTESLRAGPLEDTRTSDQAVSSSAFRELILTDLRPELPRITAPT